MWLHASALRVAAGSASDLNPPSVTLRQSRFRPPAIARWRTFQSDRRERIGLLDCCDLRSSVSDRARHLQPGIATP
jgi:hypothetical protein